MMTASGGGDVASSCSSRPILWVEGRDGHMFHRQCVKCGGYACPLSAAGIADGVPLGGFETQHERRVDRSGALSRF